MNNTKLLLGVVILGSVLASTADAQVNGRGFPHPKFSFDRSHRGKTIPAVVGNRLNELASWYGRTGEQLKQLCETDRNLNLDRQGHLHYICQGLLPLRNAVLRGQTATGADVIESGPFPEEQTFLLHSKADAALVIYLDFDGHVTTGTQWNASFTGGAAITTPPFAQDADTTTFSSSELAAIQSIWQRVAEDFAPFNVDVTTQDPGADALVRSGRSDTRFGVRVCVGGSCYDWFGSGAGGVAYLNSFNWNSDTPIFVFTEQLGKGHPKYTAEAVSHETGHSFNLTHDGQANITEYYQGHNGWAPIMGVGYYQDVVQWSKGEYANANNKQDDTAVIAQTTGYRVDAHGSTIDTATLLEGMSPQAAGIIERAGDTDWFEFTTGAGQIGFKAQAWPTSPDLDIQLVLYDAMGAAVAKSSSEGMNAALDASVEQGTYFLAVDGVGTGDPVTAYNEYGSLGSFTLAGALMPVTGQAPVAAISTDVSGGEAPVAVVFSSEGSYDPDGKVTAFGWDFGDGSTSSEAFPAHTYEKEGIYTASLVVKDDAGLTSEPAKTQITVTAAPTQEPPVAVATADVTSGLAPLVVTFSGAGSSDSDGKVVTYRWDFGDGSAPSSEMSPTHQYANVGLYVASLVVTDNDGLESTPSQLKIQVDSEKQPLPFIAVGDVKLSVSSSRRGTLVTAAVTVVDQAGRHMPGVTVTGEWSGIVSGEGSRKTNRRGIAAISAPRTKENGVFTFTVTSLMLDGFVYQPDANLKTSDSISTE